MPSDSCTEGRGGWKKALNSHRLHLDLFVLTSCPDLLPPDADPFAELCPSLSLGGVEVERGDLDERAALRLKTQIFK